MFSLAAIHRLNEEASVKAIADKAEEGGTITPAELDEVREEAMATGLEEGEEYGYESGRESGYEDGFYDGKEEGLEEAQPLADILEYLRKSGLDAGADMIVRYDAAMGGLIFDQDGREWTLRGKLAVTLDHPGN